MHQYHNRSIRMHDSRRIVIQIGLPDAFLYGSDRLPFRWTPLRIPARELFAEGDPGPRDRMTHTRAGSQRSVERVTRLHVHPVRNRWRPLYRRVHPLHLSSGGQLEVEFRGIQVRNVHGRRTFRCHDVHVRYRKHRPCLLKSRLRLCIVGRINFGLQKEST